MDQNVKGDGPRSFRYTVLKPYFQGREQLLLAELREWKGTRFWARAGARAEKGIGADCVSFVERVLVNTGAIQPIRWPEYVISGGGERMRELVFQVMNVIPEMQTVWKSEGEFELRSRVMPGDILFRSIRNDHHHLAIYAGNNTLWHCVRRGGVGTANLHDAFAIQDLQAIYRVYEIK